MSDDRRGQDEGESMEDLLATISSCACDGGVRVAVAESLTSGALATALGSAPKTSEWFLGGVVAYAPGVKFDVLGVTPGPVITAPCAIEMASGVARLLGASVVAAVTGAGGPGPEEGRPAGTVFLAHGPADDLRVEELHLDGDPQDVIRGTVEAAVRALAEDVRRSQR